MQNTSKGRPDLQRGHNALKQTNKQTNKRTNKQTTKQQKKSQRRFHFWATEEKKRKFLFQSTQTILG
jgi:hypothetical protein